MIRDFSVRIEDTLLKKLHYIAKYEDRSANKEILHIIRKRVEEFEGQHGKIESEEK